MEQTFAYGSNLSQSQMSVRCPTAQIIGVARLADHKLAFDRYSFHWEGGVADVVPAPGNEVWGLLWTLSPDDMRALDVYEGYPTGYTRAEMTLELRDGSTDLGWIYTVVQKSDFVPPRLEYLEIICEAAREFDFPTEYRRMLEEVETAG